MNPNTVHRLLDPNQAAALLAVAWPRVGAEGIVLESVWAKPGRHFNACYRAREDGRERLLSLCIVDDREAKHAMRRAEPSNPVAMAADDVLVQAFPFDYRLAHLAECADPRSLDAVVGERSADAAEVAAYRPGMRCQFRYFLRGVTRAYGKVAVERDPGRRRGVHQRLAEATASTTLRVPALLGSVESIGLDVVEAVGGSSLHDELAVDPAPGLVAKTVAALAELHAAVPAPTDRVHTVADELALVQSWTTWMGEVEPALAVRLDAILASLAGAAPDTRPASFAHRDFHDRQVLVDGSRLWLLDVDTACTGDRELDLGNFLSQLFLRGLQWDRPAALRKLEETAEQGYGPAARPGVTRWYRRSSLLRLACLYQLRPRWRHVVPALLDEASRP